MMPGGKLSQDELEKIEREVADLQGTPADPAALRAAGVSHPVGDVPVTGEEDPDELIARLAAENPIPDADVEFDRDDLIRQIVERLEIPDETPDDERPIERTRGKEVGEAFERMLLADMYATMFEFRLWADAYQKGGIGKLLLGGGGRRRRRAGKE